MDKKYELLSYGLVQYDGIVEATKLLDGFTKTESSRKALSEALKKKLSGGTFINGEYVEEGESYRQYFVFTPEEAIGRTINKIKNIIRNETGIIVRKLPEVEMFYDNNESKFLFYCRMRIYYNAKKEVKYETKKQYILSQIINHYGFENQLDQLIEEASELIQRAIKIKRYGITDKTLEDFTEEAADLQVVKDQLVYYLNITQQHENVYKSKIERTLENIRGSINGTTGTI